MFAAGISIKPILENMIADGVVALFFGVLLVWFINWRNRPQLKIIVNLESSPRVDFHWVSVVIANQGYSAFNEREINWHIYRPHTLGGEFIGKDGKTLNKEQYPFEKLGESIIDGIQYSHLSDWNKQPIFPGKEINILRFHLGRPYEADKIGIRYEFSTKLGPKPKWVWNKLRWERLRDKNDFPKLHLLPYATVRDIRFSEYRGKSFVPPEQLSGTDY